MLKKYPLTDTIIFSDPTYPIIIQKKESIIKYDPEHPYAIYHEELEIKLILEGSYTMMVNDVIHTVHPGDIVVINPYEHHYTIDMGTSTAVYHLYMLSLDFLRIFNPCTPDLRYKLLGEKVCFQNIIHHDLRLQQILLSAHTEWHEKREDWQLNLNCLMTEFFVLLLRDYTKSEQNGTVKISSLQYYNSILPALVYINENFAQKISIDILAELCHFSKCYFCRLFKQVTGQTVVNYINHYRLRLADHMMQTQNLTTPEIAKRCGFEDVNYFYRLYKRYFGHTRYHR